MSKQVVFITGVSRGLGAALVHSFIAEGYIVCGLTRTSDKQAQFQELYSDAEYCGVVADVGKPDQVNDAFDSVNEQYGRIDIVFNNAAVYPKVNFLEETAEDFVSALITNVGGVANVCKAVLPIMIRQKQGKIYNLGSWADINPIQDSAAYSASKGSIHSLTKAIARDIEATAPDAEIEVHEWIPGHLNTQMSDFTGIDPSTSAKWATQIVKHKPSTRNAIFENDHEWHAPEPLKKRLLKVFLRSNQP